MGKQRVARRHEFGYRFQRGAALLALTLGLVVAVRANAAAPGPVHSQGGRAGSVHAPGYLGIGFHDLTEEQAAALHLKGNRGVEVLMVDHDGPAGKSGLRPHDVLVSLNGQPITSAELLTKMIHDAGAGVGLTLGIVRDGHAQTMNVQLAERADVEREARARMADVPPDTGDAVVSGFVETYSVERAPATAARGPSFLESMLHTAPFTGLAMEEMEPQLAGFFGAPMGAGLLVETVVANSPAASVGLRAGDVVLRVDGVMLKSSSEWMKRLHANKGQPMVLVVLRERHEQIITLTPEFKKRSAMEWPRGLVELLQGE
jgi:S1-C subfamily serine protease